MLIEIRFRIGDALFTAPADAIEEMMRAEPRLHPMSARQMVDGKVRNALHAAANAACALTDGIVECRFHPTEIKLQVAALPNTPF